MHDDAPLVTRMDSPASSSQPGPVPGLPDDLLRDSARRLRVIALIYAGGFLLGEASYALLDPAARAELTQFYGWGPPVFSITVALVVAALASSRRIPPARLMTIGLVFEVIGAYGIAFAAYWGVYRGLAYEPAHLEIFGLSFVAPWIMFFTIVSPNQPWRALLAAIGAGSAVPVTLVLTVAYGGTSIVLTPSLWLSALLVPYFMIVVTAWVGARVVYSLGAAVSKARELGSYRLTDRLGGGGMGEVWRAKHRMLARPAAIKLIRPDKLGTGTRESQATLRHRFEREAQATALMRSPHTIDVYDFGMTADGTFYYVMELLEGFDLETLVQRFGPLPSERALYLLRQMCDSLAEAHEYELIHRDIKPANVYLCRRGQPVDFVKLLDFGLVKPRHGSGGRDPNLTAAHQAGGTPAYMAPEQACGGEVDARSDLYAVGCVAYWLVTGELVFRGRTSMQVMAHHLQTAPERPSHRSELPIPAAFEAVILSCLEKDPARRPQNAAELDAALAACETGTPWTPDRARKWWALHQPTVVAGQTAGGAHVHVV
ncbi:MAG: serine/threonine protein kinase [Gemmatimonadota bacterium]|nr:serine/threonine protein kinase [Gemmatimonadota bacterium]